MAGTANMIHELPHHNNLMRRLSALLLLCYHVSHFADEKTERRRFSLARIFRIKKLHKSDKLSNQYLNVKAAVAWKTLQGIFI